MVLYCKALAEIIPFWIGNWIDWIDCNINVIINMIMTPTCMAFAASHSLHFHPLSIRQQQHPSLRRDKWGCIIHSQRSIVHVGQKQLGTGDPLPGAKIVKADVRPIRGFSCGLNFPLLHGAPPEVIPVHFAFLPLPLSFLDQHCYASSLSSSTFQLISCQVGQVGFIMGGFRTRLYKTDRARDFEHEQVLPAYLLVEYSQLTR